MTGVQTCALPIYIPREMLPEVKSSSEIYGRTKSGIAIGGIAGDLLAFPVLAQPDTFTAQRDDNRRDAFIVQGFGCSGRIESKGVRALVVRADQGDPAQVDALVRQVHQHFGRLDILVNSAGVFVTGSVDDPKADIGAFERQHAVNVTGVATAVRAAAPLLADGGRIVSIGTTGALRVPFPGIGDYVASKAAVAAYSRA